jgi:hypothetical protein
LWCLAEQPFCFRAFTGFEETKAPLMNEGDALFE